ncbi:MAG: hypothetical protein ACKOZW_11085 [Cyanobium sp.]
MTASPQQPGHRSVVDEALKQRLRNQPRRDQRIDDSPRLAPADEPDDGHPLELRGRGLRSDR